MRDTSDWDIIPGDLVKQTDSKPDIASAKEVFAIDGWYAHPGFGEVKRVCEIRTRKTVARYFQIKWGPKNTWWHYFGDVTRVSHRAGERE